MLFDELVIESENGVLHLKDGFESFVLLWLRPLMLREFGVLPRVDSEFSDLGQIKFTVLVVSNFTSSLPLIITVNIILQDFL